MCGIAGYIGIQEDKGALKAMTDAIKHRGPDGEGHYYGVDCALGHRRLAILDLSEAGKQPMQYLNRYVITYNGEIYNYSELREELIALNYSFTSDSDTEVLIAAYDCWGAECLTRFNGMWAFVLFDKHTNQYFIARDRFGKKPLYYYNNDDKFVFCSEVKGIYASEFVPKEPNFDYLREYLKNGPNEYEHTTAFKNVARFPFAHYFLGTKEQLLNYPEFTSYWKLEVNNSCERFNAQKAIEYAEQYYELLSDAVRLRLRADVKVGSALSGGLDSSSIVYLVNKQLRIKGKRELQETFSSVYKSRGTENCDESTYIDLLANELNVSTNQIEPFVDDVPLELEGVITNMENPPESTCMSGWHTFKKVSEKGVTVTLDGQGADEQLGGYVFYIPSYLLSLSVVDFYKELLHFLKIPGAKKQILFTFIIAHAKLLFRDRTLNYLFKKIGRRNVPIPLNEELKESFEKGLVNLIHYADHTSMSHSIESRMPFMDYRLVEFLSSVPACYKMHNGWTKYLARLAFDKKLPDEICWRKDKMGWDIPEQLWFTTKLNEYAKDSVLSSQYLADFGTNRELDFSDKNLTNLSIRKLNVALFEKIFFR